VYLVSEFGYVIGGEEDKTERMSGVLGENGVIEEVFGEEIRASYESFPPFADTLESDKRFWRQHRQDLHHHFLRHVRCHSRLFLRLRGRRRLG
jgi:hypothetical protein